MSSNDRDVEPIDGKPAQARARPSRPTPLARSANPKRPRSTRAWQQRSDLADGREGRGAVATVAESPVLETSVTEDTDVDSTDVDSANIDSTEVDSTDVDSAAIDSSAIDRRAIEPNFSPAASANGVASGHGNGNGAHPASPPRANPTGRRPRWSGGNGKPKKETGGLIEASDDNAGFDSVPAERFARDDTGMIQSASAEVEPTQPTSLASPTLEQIEQEIGSGHDLDGRRRRPPLLAGLVRRRRVLAGAATDTGSTSTEPPNSLARPDELPAPTAARVSSLTQRLKPPQTRSANSRRANGVSLDRQVFAPSALAPSGLAPQAPDFPLPTRLFPASSGADTATGYVDLDDDPPPTAPTNKRPVRTTAATRRRRPRVRRVTRVIRHVDPWSVFKIALCFSAVLYGVCLTAGVLLWNVAYTTGTIDNMERFFESFGWDTFEFKGGELYHNAWIAGLFAAVGLTGFIVLAVTLFNLITDLVGGIRVTVLEEEVVERDPARRRRPRSRRVNLPIVDRHDPDDPLDSRPGSMPGSTAGGGDASVEMVRVEPTRHLIR